MGLLSKILLKIFFLKSKNCKDPFLRNRIYQQNFHKFNQSLAKKTSTLLEPHYRLRFAEILELVEKYDIKNVVEAGSGRSTFIFNSLSDIETLSLEQDKDWLRTIDPLLNDAGIKAKFSLSKVSPYKHGARFESVPDVKPDLLYIDGPYYKNHNGEKFATHTGKAAYYDFETFFDRGIFPKVIMIEGRTDTADAILESSHADKYTFSGEFIYYLQREKFLPALSFRRHSVFIRKNLSHL